MKVYTKNGDKGMTSLIGGKKIEKDDIRVEAYGTVDELNSYIGLCYHYLKEDSDKEALRKIQVKLFDIEVYIKYNTFIDFLEIMRDI